MGNLPVDQNKIKAQQTTYLKKWNINSENLSNVKSISDVFKYKETSLSKVKKHLGPQFIETYLAIWVSEINAMACGNMTENDCNLCANMILQDYYYINSADLKLITKRMRSRKFIRVSPNEIYTEIEKYCNERSEQAQSISKEQSDKHKQSSHKDILSIDEVRDLYKKVKSGDDKLKPKENKKNRTMEYYKNNTGNFDHIK